jgi:hypothetical protein
LAAAKIRGYRANLRLECFLIWYSPPFFPGLKPESFLAAFVALAKASVPTDK